MPRNFTSFVAQTPDPEGLLNRVEDCLGDEYHYEETKPRRNDENRVRIEGRPWFRKELRSALEAGDLGPVDWAVVMVAMDEAIGVNAWIFEGDELIDTFEGAEHFTGVDTEAYLERFHGILVDRAGPYVHTYTFDPSISLAQENPDETLADEPPEPPFEVTGDDHWTLVVAETDYSRHFRNQLETRFQESGVLLDEETPTINRSWVTDDPTTVTFEDSEKNPSSRVRARVPLASPCVADEGLMLPFGPGSFDARFQWIVILHGTEVDERVRAWLFVRDRGRFTFDEAVDQIEEAPGEHGAAVAAYFDRYYGIDLDPTPEGIPTADTDTVDLEDREPQDWTAKVLEEQDTDFPNLNIE